MKYSILRDLRHHRVILERYFVIFWSIGMFLSLIYPNKWGYDDPYITYRYAENISHNAGFVYNHGEKVLGTTTPFYTLLLAFFNILGFDIPLTSNVLSCLSLVAGGIACWLLGRRWNTPIIGLVGCVLYPTFPLLTSTIGSEMPFSNALILLGIVAYVYDKHRLAAIGLALAILTRYDGLIVVGWIMIYDTLRYRRMLIWPLLIGASIVVLWVGWAWWYFGSPIPNTLTAKQHQGSMITSVSFPRYAMLLFQQYLRLGWFDGHLVLALIGMLALSIRRSPWLVVVLWNLLYFLGYTVLQVSAYFWYYAPLIVGLICFVGGGIDALSKLLQRYWDKKRVSMVQSLIMIALVMIQFHYFMKPHRDQRLDTYTAVGEWLNTNTPESARIGALEIGIIGYYAKRPIIDFAGLIQPAVSQQIGKTIGYDETARWAIQTYQPEYVVLIRGMLLETERFIQPQCVLETNFDLPPDHIVDIYRCAFQPQSLSPKPTSHVILSPL